MGLNYLKEERTKVPELLEYMHGDEHAHGDHDHADPTLKGSRKYVENSIPTIYN
jgi:hypothetical protein